MASDKAVELAILAVNSAIGEVPDDKTALIAAKCRALIAGYSARWKNAGYKPLEIERIVEAGLVNPDTQKSSRTFTIAGELDLVVEYNRRRIVFDHKTTSQDISDPNAPYWRQLVVESQPSHYILLEWLNGRKCDGAVWDVMRKPSISPKKLSKAEVARAVAERQYMDHRLLDPSLAALQVDTRETLEMYEARLRNDCIKARPEWYFARHGIPRLDAEILEYSRELWEHGQEILHARNTNRHARNSGACLLYGSPCQFLGICSGHDSADSDKWQRKPNVHTELEGLSGDGRNVITNSRIRCFQTCRMMHYFRYELGIERPDEEEKESLFFGKLWHVALAAWWSYLKEENNVTSSYDSPGSEPGKCCGSDQAIDAGRSF